MSSVLDLPLTAEKWTARLSANLIVGLLLNPSNKSLGSFLVGCAKVKIESKLTLFGNTVLLKNRPSLPIHRKLLGKYLFVMSVSHKNVKLLNI